MDNIVFGGELVAVKVSVAGVRSTASLSSTAATVMLWLWGGVVREPRQGYAHGMRLAAESPRLS